MSDIFRAHPPPFSSALVEKLAKVSLQQVEVFFQHLSEMMELSLHLVQSQRASGQQLPFQLPTFSC